MHGGTNYFELQAGCSGFRCPNVELHSGVVEIKSLMRGQMSREFRMSVWTCNSIKCKSLFWVMALRTHVFKRCKVEKVHSDEATEMGRKLGTDINRTVNMKTWLLFVAGALSNMMLHLTL